jgi:elongation factor 1-gamma
LYEKAQILQWIAFVDNEINPAVGKWLYPIMGYADFNFKDTENAKASAKRFMGSLNTHLRYSTFLVGNSVTLADITAACHIMPLFMMVFDKEWRNEFQNVTRWFLTCVNQPMFKAVLGEIKLCTEMQVYQSKKTDKKVEKKEEKKVEKKVEKKEAPPKPAEDPEDSVAEEKPKGKNPLDMLPKSKLVLDEWKRCYSNNDTRPTAVDWFWQNFDKEGYAMWKVDYKYNDELKMTFMSSNLVGGFFQRLERARKYAFGSMVILGQDNKNEITGFFVIRGQEIPPEVSEAADFDSYTFVKVNTDDAKVKENFNAVIAWDEKIYGKTFADGKIFK